MTSLRPCRRRFQTSTFASSCSACWRGTQGTEPRLPGLLAAASWTEVGPDVLLWQWRRMWQAFHLQLIQAAQHCLRQNVSKTSPPPPWRDQALRGLTCQTWPRLPLTISLSCLLHLPAKTPQQQQSIPRGGRRFTGKRLWAAGSSFQG